MKAEISPDRYRLTDGEVTLRPFVPGDKKRLAELGNNVNIFRNLRDGFPHPYTVADAERFIAMVMEHVPPHAFAIEKLGMAPCRDACPTGQRAQGYIALINDGPVTLMLEV